VAFVYDLCSSDTIVISKYHTFAYFFEYSLIVAGEVYSFKLSRALFQCNEQGLGPRDHSSSVCSWSLKSCV